MTLEEKCRLSYYKKIADISTHKNVYLVQHVENNRIYVRKEQKIYCKEVYEYLEQCDNPHIPKIYECIEDNGELIIIEEYIQGESLAAHLEEKGLYNCEEVCQIMITICDVLEQLHNLPKPVIHRDLKPENIIVQENGYLKIIDFNTAKQFEQGKDTDTVIIGTRKYAAPEQFGFRQSDARTDIYALGVMMNYLLTKEYLEDRLYETDSRHDSLMSKIICKCIEFSPDNRYQSVAELRKDLQNVLKVKSSSKYYQGSKKQKIPDEKKGSGLWKISFLPPGFRTGTRWKMLLGGIGYFFIFWIGLFLEVTNPDGNVVSGFELWAYRMTVLIWMLLTVAFYTDYMRLQEILPMMGNKYLKWIGYVIYPGLFFIILVMILILIT